MRACSVSGVSNLFKLSFLSTLLMLAACSSEPTHKLTFNEQTNVTEVAATLEKAMIQSPEDESIPFTLSELYFKSADRAYQKAEARQKEDLAGKIENLRSAREYAEKSIAVLSPILAKPKAEDGFADRMKKLADSKHKTWRERQEILNQSARNLRGQIRDEDIDALQATLDKVLADTVRILDANRKKPGSAYDDFIPFFPYAPYLPEVASAKLEIEKLTIQQLDQQVLNKIEKKDYNGATVILKRMEGIAGGADISLAGMRSITSHKAFLARNFDLAFDEMLAIQGLHPESVFYKNYFEKVRSALVAATLQKVDGLMAEARLPAYFEAFEKVDRLKKAGEGNADILSKIEPLRAKLRKLTAALLVRRAGELKKQDMNLYSSLILRNLRMARVFDAEQVAEKLQEDAEKALGMTNRKGEIRVAVSVDGATGLASDWASRIEGNLAASLDNAKIAGLEVVDRKSLKGGTGLPGVVDMAVKISLDAVEFSEKGRDAPRKRSSKYVSGTRQVDNPEYPRAKQAYEEANALYNSSYTLQQEAKRKCRDMGSYLLQIACEGAISYVSSSGRDTAYAKWRATPEYLTQNIISSYQYDQYTVSVSGRASGKCSVQDNLSRTESKCVQLNEKFKREGNIITNAQHSDTEGIRNINEAPDIAGVQDAAFGKVQEVFSSDLVQQVINQKAERYCRLADKLKRPEEKQRAMEALSLCLIDLEKEKHKRVPEIEKRLNEYMQVTAAQAQAYGSGKIDDTSWPAAADVDDKDMKLVMLKLGSAR